MKKDLKFKFEVSYSDAPSIQNSQESGPDEDTEEGLENILEDSF